MEGELGVSTKGKSTFVFNGYEFCKHRTTKEEFTVWRCSMSRKLKCKANVVSDGPKVVRVNNGEHNHEGCIAKYRAKAAVCKMKALTNATTGGPSAIQGAVSADLPDDVLMALPRKSTLTRTLRRHRQKEFCSGSNIATPLPTDLLFEIPGRFRNFVLFDSGPDPLRLLIFGNTDLLHGLARSDLWLADGTFKVVPALYFQLYTIHFHFVDGVNPAAVYCLLPNKTRETYDRLLSEIKRLIPSANPIKVLVDFEAATLGAFREAFPNAVVSGCFFHLSQSIMRKVNELGLKIEYENNDEVSVGLFCFHVLSSS